MVQRQLNLSDDANEFIQQQLATGQFASPDEVVSKTLEEAQVAAAKKKEFGLSPENGGGGGGGGMNLESFQKLSPAERTQFYRDNPDQYVKFMDAIRTKSERDLFDKKGAPAL